MKHTAQFIFAIVIMTTTLSCKKEDKITHVSGKVLDGTTGASISNATINIMDVNEGQQIGTITSDANGDYNYATLGEHTDLSFQVIYSDFYTSPWGKDFDLALDETCEKNNFNLTIYPPAYAKLIAVKHETIYDWINFYYAEHLPSGIAGVTVTNSLPTSFRYKFVKGGFYTSLKYSISKVIYGPPYTTSDSSITTNIYCAPRDTTDFYFTY